MDFGLVTDMAIAWSAGDYSSAGNGQAGGGFSQAPGGPRGYDVALAVGACASVLVTVGAVGFLCTWLWRRKQGYHSNVDDLNNGGGDSWLECCWPTRSTSLDNLVPLPTMTTSPSDNHGNEMMARAAVPMETIPFTVPNTERIQPSGPGEQVKPITTAYNYQQHFLGQLQPELYKYTDEDDETEKHLPPSPSGRIWFSVVFDASVQTLTVSILKVKHLPPRDKNNASRDTFVRVYLLPDERMSQQSKVRRKTLNPRFNETFVFQVSETEVRERMLRLSVYDMDRRRVRHSLGHVILPLTEVDLAKDELMWRDLEDAAHASTVGELNVSLSYLPSMDRLKVVILRAKNFRRLEFDDTAVYVKVQLMHGRKPVKTKKTAPQQGHCEQVYNESFSFTVTAKQLEQTSVQVTIVATGNGRLSSDEEYGRFVLGPFMFARGEELLHWQEMLAEPRKVITRWHSLTTS